MEDRSQPAPREPLAKDFAKDTVGPLPNAGRPASVGPHETKKPTAPGSNDEEVTSKVGGISSTPFTGRGAN